MPGDKPTILVLGGNSGLGRAVLPELEHTFTIAEFGPDIPDPDGRTRSQGDIENDDAMPFAMAVHYSAPAGILHLGDITAEEGQLHPPSLSPRAINLIVACAAQWHAPAVFGAQPVADTVPFKGLRLQQVFGTHIELAEDRKLPNYGVARCLLLQCVNPLITERDIEFDPIPGRRKAAARHIQDTLLNPGREQLIALNTIVRERIANHGRFARRPQKTDSK